MGYQRVISLPALNRQVTLGQYCAAVRLAKANPERRFRQTFRDWSGGTGAEIMREFRAAVHDRINAGSYRMAEGWQRAGASSGFRPAKPRGRKDCSDWFIRAWRDSRRCRDIANRVIVRQFETAEARRRLGHLLWSGDDL